MPTRMSSAILARALVALVLVFAGLAKIQAAPALAQTVPSDCTLANVIVLSTDITSTQVSYKLANLGPTDCPVTLATYKLPDAGPFPLSAQTQYDVAYQTIPANGKEVVGPARIPNCWTQIDLDLGHYPQGSPPPDVRDIDATFANDHVSCTPPTATPAPPTATPAPTNTPAPPPAAPPAAPAATPVPPPPVAQFSPPAPAAAAPEQHAAPSYEYVCVTTLTSNGGLHTERVRTNQANELLGKLDQARKDSGTGYPLAWRENERPEGCGVTDIAPTPRPTNTPTQAPTAPPTATAAPTFTPTAVPPPAAIIVTVTPPTTEGCITDSAGDQWTVDQSNAIVFDTSGAPLPCGTLAPPTKTPFEVPPENQNVPAPAQIPAALPEAGDGTCAESCP
jgi:hypothetical protein